MIILSVSVLFLNNTSSDEIEGFDTVPIKYEVDIDLPSGYTLGQMSISDKNNGYYFTKDPTDPSKRKKVKLPYGYYKVDDSVMAVIPYGYMLVNQGDDESVDYMKQIVPKTTAKIYQSGNSLAYNTTSGFFADGKAVNVPANGEVPDEMYVLPSNHGKMAKLPPNMKPNIDSLDIEGTAANPILKKKYSSTLGYISENEYYAKVYTLTENSTSVFKNLTNDIAFKLPDGIYYFDNNKVKNTNVLTLSEWDQYNNSLANKVQFLPYGKIPKRKPDGNFLPGYIDNPSLISKTGTFGYDQNYSDIKNNYSVEFHGNIDTLKAQNDMYDISFGEITVLDKTGNLVVLPRSQIQGDITYYQPATFRFGAATYVPKYEDSVYLSRTSHMPTMAEYRSAFKTVGFCEEHQHSPIVIEEKCNALSAETCGSTSCCVLLGGSKCVSGNTKGPTMKQNYGDVFIRNKDFYTHLGKCYGNCP